jgi:hypothetical protein
MKEAPQPVQTFFKWVCRIFGVLMLLPSLSSILLLLIFAVFAIKHPVTFKLDRIGGLGVAWMVPTLLGLWLVRMGWRKENRSLTPLPTWLAWVCWIGGSLFLCLQALSLFISVPMAKVGAQLVSEKAPKDAMGLFFLVALCYGPIIGNLMGFLIGLVIVRWPGMRLRSVQAQPGSPVEPTVTPEPVKATPVISKNRRWSSANILHLAPDAKRLWKFDAKGKSFVLGGEQRVPHAETLPSTWVGKSWGDLLQPKLNVAWLPSENVFLRVVELPAANADETFSMVELQLEKLSPFPVTQIVWTMHYLGTHQSPPKADGTVESLQTVIVVIASRAVVEEFMGRLERDGFLSDRLEAPMLDQLEAVAPKEDSVWLFPTTIGGQNAALVAWWFGGAWRNLSFVTLPPAGDRAGELKTQLGLLAMAGEVEGWLTSHAEWHLVADPVNATEWEQLLRAALNEPVRVIPPPSPAELAGRSASRAAASTVKAQLQPEEYSARYREQFSERLWLHALGYAGVVYAVVVIFWLSMGAWVGFQARGVESQVAALGGAYTNAIQLKAKLGVLQERSQLKFAALDSMEQVAETIPAALTLRRWSFAEGSRLSLSGEVAADDTQKLIDFYDALRKAKKDNQPFFSSEGGDPLAYRQSGNNVSWSFSLILKHAEEVK